jgi:multidrug efflux pump subunit AcrA (membrane-fusion protein)
MADASESGFLHPDPPPYAARALALLLLALFSVCVGALFVVQVPETVAARFVLVPVKGSNPVRTLHDGIVTAVHAGDAQAVEAGTTLFTLDSESVGDRTSEWQALGTRLSGGNQRLANERAKYDNQRRGDEQERLRLEARLAALGTQAALKQRQAKLAREVAARQQRSVEEGLTSFVDAARSALEADRLELEVEQARADAAETRAVLARLHFEIASRRAAFDELTRSVDEELERSRSRKNILDQEGSRDGGKLAVVAPCAGTIVKLLVRSAGAVVKSQDVLAEIVCHDERLQAELAVPPRGLGLIASGQPVKLRYDAFPYERYGIRYATLRWLAPSSSAAEGAFFRALADLDDQSVQIAGQTRQLLPGMGGAASIVVGRRVLASYAFEPIRQAREALAIGPARGRGSEQ